MIIELYDSRKEFPRGFEFFITAEGDLMSKIPSPVVKRDMMQVVLEHRTDEFPTYQQELTLVRLESIYAEHRPRTVAFYNKPEWNP